MGGEQRTGRPRPRVLIVGGGEPGIGSLCSALRRRAIEPILIEGSIEHAIRSERPNLLLLVGDAASDDGARAIDDARQAASTPIVVATDPEPLDRRLAPFALGASGVLVRRDDPDEMAGELQHLLAENARRIAESVDDRAPEELDGLIGLRARELLSRPTPIEGVPLEITPPGVPSWPTDEVPTIPGVVAPAKGAGSLPDWDDLTTKRQPAPEVARWRRLSASDRGAMATPEARPALDEKGAPRAVVSPEPDADAGARAARGRELTPFAPALPEPRRTPEPRAISDAPPAIATEPALPASGARSPSSPPRARSSSPPPSRTSPPARVPPPPPPSQPEAARPSSTGTSSTGERISASALVALGPPSRPPIEDRASTLRAKAMPRPRASTLPALIGLAIVIVAAAAIAGPRAIEIARVATRSGTGSEPATGTTAIVIASAAVPTPSPEPTRALPPAPEPRIAEIAPALPTSPALPVPPSPTSPAPSPSADALVRDARTLARRGDRDGERALLEQAVALDPNDPHAAIALAQHFVAEGAAEDAIRMAQRAVALRRRRPEYHVVLGDAYRLAGDEAHARASWETAHELDPDRADARERLGL